MMIRHLSRALALLVCIAAVRLNAQTVNATQQLQSAGLRSTNGLGRFLGGHAAADGSGVFVLYDQGDGVRVYKFSNDGTNLLAQAQLGSKGADGEALTVDPAGNVYVTGTASGNALTATSGVAFAAPTGSSTNSFLAKLDPSLNTVFITYLGAAQTVASAVAATADAVFVTGLTYSAAFPVTPAAAQQTPASGTTQNGFVERFTTNGQTLTYATYLTGVGGTTAPSAIAADTSDDAYVGGATSASGYPTIAALVPRIITTASNSGSGFLTKLSPDGSAFLFSTFVPGLGIGSLALSQNASLLIASALDFGAFPVTAVAAPVGPVIYESVLQLTLDGQTIHSSVALAASTHASVVPDSAGGVWLAGTLIAPLFAGITPPFADTGDSFALHLTSALAVDQTARMGGAGALSTPAASVTTSATTPALTGDGALLVLSQVALNSAQSLPASRYDVPVANAPNPAVPQAVRDVATAACALSQCTPAAGYAAVFSTTASAPALALSTDNLPNITLRNLGSASAQGLSLTASGYTVSSDCGQQLEPAGECAIALSGNGPGSITVSASNATAQTATLPATPALALPLAITPAELDFGIATSDALVSRTFTVTNLTQSTQSFSSAAGAIGNNNDSLIEQQSDCGSGSPKLLAAGAVCHITLGFLASPAAANDGVVHAAWTIGSLTLPATAVSEALQIEVSAPAVSFGTQFTGGLRTPRYLYLSNNSASAVTHTPVALPATLTFTVTDACPNVLAPHSVCQLRIDYTQTTAPSSDAVTLALDEGVSVPVTAQLLPQATANGAAANPSIAVSPATLNFTAPVVVSGLSSTQPTVTVMNTGNASVPLTITISPEFLLTDGCPAMLAAGASCTLAIQFAPSQPGTRTGLISIASGGSFAPTYVSLSGTAAALLPSNNALLNLGQTYAGEPLIAWFKIQQSVSKLTATASGSALQVALVPDNGYGHGTLSPSQFAGTATLACGNCWLGVQLLSNTAGTANGTLSLITVTGGNAYIAQLTGTVDPVSGIVISPVAQDFGTIDSGSTSADEIFTIANFGGASAATINSTTLTGPFVQGTNAPSEQGCAGTLASGQSCIVHVHFAPTANDPASGTLTVATSLGNVSATLTGFGSPSQGLALMPETVIFRNDGSAAATQQTIAITNTSAYTATVGTLSVVGTGFSATTSCTTLAPSASCTMTVTYAPATAQTQGALTLPLVLNVNGQPVSEVYTVPLSALYTSYEAGLVLLPEQANFGTQSVTALSSLRTFQLTNTTAKTLTVSLMTAREFPVTADGCTGSLAAEASCSFSVQMLPQVAGPLSGTVFVNAVPTDGSAALEALTYLEGFAGSASTLSLSGPALVPEAPLSFGQVASGQTSTQTLTITNTGTTPVNVRRLTSAPPFNSATTCTSPIAVGASCTVTISYAPMYQTAGNGTTSTGPRTDAGELVIESDAASSPDEVELTGMVSPQVVAVPVNTTVLTAYTLSDGALDFAATAVGNVSAAQTVTLTNTGNETLHFSSVLFLSDFSGSTTCAAVTAGGSCTITVAFSPTTQSMATLRIGAIEVVSDATTSLEFITLLGSSSPSTLSLGSNALDFGTVALGQGLTQNVTVTNSGTAPITFVSVTATGDYSAGNGTCPANGGALAGGASCMVAITFRPTAIGQRTGTLSVTTSASTGPLTVALTGIGATSQLTATPASLAFGNIAVGSAANATLTLSNAGTLTATGLANSITGPNAAEFAVTTPCTVTQLAPNQGCTQVVTFTPAGTGTRSATLLIASSDPASPLSIPLTGIGVPASGSFTLTAQTSSANVKSGSPASYLLTVTPLNGFTGTVALTCAPLTTTPYAACSLLPPSVVLGSAQTVTVTINTITSNARSVSWAGFGLGVFLMGLSQLRRGRRRRCIFSASIVMMACWIAGCGGSNPGNGNLKYTPAGTYQYQVTASSTTGTVVSQSVTLTLVVQ